MSMTQKVPGMNAGQLSQWFRTMSPEQLQQKARKTALRTFGSRIFIRGLIEISSYCRNDCYYCGLRRSNPACQRYRLTKEEILDCAKKGYDLGFRTIVLQSGEDPWYTDEKICDIVSAIRKQQPDCAITLSIGEKSRESYLRYFEASKNHFPINSPNQLFITK